MYCWLRDVCVCAGLPIVYLGNSSHLRFCDLVRVDTIEVEVLPEKKGVFMKHVEYLITSKVSLLLWEATRPQTTFHVCLRYYTVFQIKKVITLRPNNNNALSFPHACSITKLEYIFLSI